MNTHRRLYNRMLTLKFSMLEILDTKEQKAMKEQFDLINEHLQDLDELATGVHIDPIPHEQFITGKK